MKTDETKLRAQVNAGRFDYRGYAIAGGQAQLGGRLRGDQRDQGESAVELDAGQRAFQNYGADGSGQAIARGAGGGLAGERNVFGADAGEAGAGLAGERNVFGADAG